MSFLVHVILLVAANAFGIWLAQKVIPGITFSGDMVHLLLVGALMGVINALAKPILKLLTLPLILLTLGLFSIIINMFLLFVVDILTPELTIDTITGLFLGTLLLLVVNMGVSPFIKKI